MGRHDMGIMHQDRGTRNWSTSVDDRQARPSAFGTDIASMSPMRMITKGRFAVTAMVDLALFSANGPTALKAISRRQGISISYLDQLFGKLRESGLVEATRGPAGGYSLARAAASISVADILAAVDDLIDETVHVEPPGKARNDRAAAVVCDVWRDVNAEMEAFFAAIPLDTLVDAQQAKGWPAKAVPGSHGISPEPVVKPIRTDAPNSVFALADSLMRQSKAS